MFVNVVCEIFKKKKRCFIEDTLLAGKMPCENLEKDIVGVL